MVGAQFVLATYLKWVKDKGQPNGRPYMPKTLVNYLNAAHTYLQLATGQRIPIREPKGQGTKLLPIFGETIAISQKWCQPKAKREGYTWFIFQALRAMVREATRDDITCYLDMVACVFDWIRLGCFTGSRAGEYAQTVAKKGEYSMVPNDPSAGQWAGYATAFVKQDFVLLNRRMVVLPNTWDTLHKSKQVFEVHVCFRFDKSKENFTVRKFRRGTSFMYPVDAVLCILRRALILKVSDKQPVGVYRTGNRGRFTYLRSCEVIEVVRAACRRAYPPDHFLRLHIDRLVAHSNRVTAAVALYLQNWQIEQIAHRLRWHPESVKHYLRESSHHIGQMTKDAINGAMVM